MNVTVQGHSAVAVVVVGYNHRQLVRDCLRSLQTVDYAPLQVIYVDNDSSDGSLDDVRGAFPEVVAIPSGGNLGYCGGNNAGIARALDAGAEFVLILNPDTVVCAPGFVTKLVNYLLAHPRVGKVGPKVYLHEHGKVQNTILGWPSIMGSVRSVLATMSGRKTGLTSDSVAEATEVASLNGCCLLVRAEALRSVGLYDVNFWCYMDEVDWDWRAEHAGWKRHYVPVESIVHLQKTTGYDYASRTNYYLKRNAALWYAKTGKWVSMAAWMLITLTIAMVRAVGAPLVGRSPKQYLSFVGKIAAAYSSILWDLRDGKITAHAGPQFMTIVGDRG